MATNRKNGFTPGIETLEDRCLLSSGHHPLAHHLAHGHMVHVARLHPGHGRHPRVNYTPPAAAPAFALSAQRPSTPTLPPALPAPVNSGSHTSSGGISVDSFSFSVNALGLRVEHYAEGLVGQSAVGRGECTDLVQAALTNAGAQSWYDYDVYGNLVSNDNPNSAPYVWGRLVATYKAGDSTSVLNADTVQPGDIIQYANVRTSTSIADHHSAIVAWNLGNGNIKVLEQHAGTPNVVRKDSENFSSMTQGTIWVYRPLAG